MPFVFGRADIPEIILVANAALEDERGFFRECYKYSEFASFGITENFLQDSHSRSRKGVLRGLHYQKVPQAQAKLVRVVAGAILDVAVDMRRNSETYGKWVAVNLSAENGKSLYIPLGFAHGFCVLTEIADVLYKTTRERAPECERGVLWNDPDLAIAWPIPHPIVSSADSSLPRFRNADNNF